jgi:hypothetical protein
VRRDSLSRGIVSLEQTRRARVAAFTCLRAKWLEHSGAHNRVDESEPIVGLEDRHLRQRASGAASGIGTQAGELRSMAELVVWPENRRRFRQGAGVGSEAVQPRLH